MASKAFFKNNALVVEFEPVNFEHPIVDELREE